MRTVCLWQERTIFHTEMMDELTIWKDVKVKRCLTDCSVLRTLTILKNIRNPLIFLRKMATYSCFWRVPSSEIFLQASLRQISDLLTLVSYSILNHELLQISLAEDQRILNLFLGIFKGLVLDLNACIAVISDICKCRYIFAPVNISKTT